LSIEGIFSDKVDLSNDKTEEEITIEQIKEILNGGN